MTSPQIEQARYFLKDTIRQAIDISQTDQNRGLEPPPLEKPYPADGRRINLTPPGKWQNIAGMDLETAIRNRQSRRLFREEAISLDELSFLLWATQGVRRTHDRKVAFRTVPSAGARHAFETYVAAIEISGLEKGFYRYLPFEHQLLFEFQEKQAEQKLVEAALGQTFVGQAPSGFFVDRHPYAHGMALRPGRS